MPMRIGVIADSHDHLPALEAAVRRFCESGVGFVIHAGDFVAPFSLEPLEALKCPWIGVFGNNDGEHKGLIRRSKGRIQPAPFELNLDGKKVTVVHELTEDERRRIAGEGTQILIHAHTHQPSVETSDGMLLVNPGELCGWLTRRRTLAIVDTAVPTATIEDLSLP
jgi:putative phosphoesterase